MPVYEYACEKCKHEFEAEQRISDDPIRTCPKCRARKVKRLISRTSFVLKGSGWYSDLYASPGAKKDGDAEAGGESGDKAPRATRSPTPSRRRSPRRSRREARGEVGRQGQGQGEEQVESGLIARSDGALLTSAPVETIVVDGLALAQEIRKELSEAVGRHVAAGRRAPHLAVVRVGDDPASASYIKGKRRACESVGHRLDRDPPARGDDPGRGSTRRSPS